MDIDDDDIDGLRELINIGVGRAAGLLNDMTGYTIRLNVPLVRIIRLTDISPGKGIIGLDKLSTVSLQFKGALSGLTALVFPPESAAALVLLLSGEESSSRNEMDALRIETLKEVGNIIINAVMGSIANVLHKHLTYALPTYQEITIPALTHSGVAGTGAEWVVLANTHFLIENTSIEGNIMLVLEVGSLDMLIDSIRKMDA
jgi:chemotaxis protein CheC